LSSAYCRRCEPASADARWQKSRHKNLCRPRIAVCKGRIPCPTISLPGGRGQGLPAAEPQARPGTIPQNQRTGLRSALRVTVTENMRLFNLTAPFVGTRVISSRSPRRDEFLYFPSPARSGRRSSRGIQTPGVPVLRQLSPSLTHSKE
jgi:hypothetical protein